MNKAEIVIFRDAKNEDFHIEVRVEDDTVWLTQMQMGELFEATKQNISLHIRNIYKEGELEESATVKEYLTIQSEGGRKVSRKVLYYNLDVIISVGYRVKSLRGTQFRKWANKVLRDYLLKGYAINNRMEKVEQDVLMIKGKVDEIEFHLSTNLPQEEGIFFDGQIFDAWQFASQLVKQANESIILIDNYVDESVLHLLSKRKPGTSATVFSNKITKQLETDLKKHNQQYPAIQLEHFSKSHDRFLILDRKVVYHIGASLKDLGKRWFAFSIINIDPMNIINKLT